MTQNETPFPSPLPMVAITTDGSARPNPGLGAWACVLRFGTAYKELSGRSSGETTNNLMEMTAVVEGLKHLKKPCRVQVRTDSKIAISWCRDGSFAKVKKQLRYPEAFALSREFARLAKIHTVTFQWVRGHNGDMDNERCDVLAGGHGA